MNISDLPEGYRVEVTRGSGPGGQHKNKVETCVTVIYDLLGFKSTCQETRSKLKNFEIAFNRVKTMVKDHDSEKQNKAKNALRKAQLVRRKRTYNYKTGIVTDHVTGKKAPLSKVLNGDIELLK